MFVSPQLFYSYKNTFMHLTDLAPWVKILWLSEQVCVSLFSYTHLFICAYTHTVVVIVLLSKTWDLVTLYCFVKIVLIGLDPLLKYINFRSLSICSFNRSLLGFWCFLLAVDFSYIKSFSYEYGLSLLLYKTFFRCVVQFFV